MPSTINLRDLAAVSHAASNEKDRYYLNGVLVNACAARIELTATDGHMLLATSAANKGDLRGRWIIPLAICARFKIGKRENGLAELSHADGRRLRLSYLGQSVEFDAIDGTFPDWRGVVPRKYDGETAQFDAAILSRFEKAGRAFGFSNPGRIAIAHNAGGPALVSWGADVGEAFGVIMPYRAHDAHLPSWVDEPEEAPASEQAEETEPAA